MREKLEFDLVVSYVNKESNIIIAYGDLLMRVPRSTTLWTRDASLVEGDRLKVIVTPVDAIVEHPYLLRGGHSRAAGKIGPPPGMVSFVSDPDLGGDHFTGFRFIATDTGYSIGDLITIEYFKKETSSKGQQAMAEQLCDWAMVANSMGEPSYPGGQWACKTCGAPVRVITGNRPVTRACSGEWGQFRNVTTDEKDERIAQLEQEIRDLDGYIREHVSDVFTVEALKVFREKNH